ncbi:hypothetical protein RCL1_004530 [Eukaryota sp. TZLM3-RCL]
MDEDRLSVLLRKNFSKKPSNRLTEDEKAELLRFRESMSPDQWNVLYNQAKQKHQERRAKKLALATLSTSPPHLTLTELDRSPTPITEPPTPVEPPRPPTIPHPSPSAPSASACLNCQNLTETHERELMQAQQDQDELQDKLDTLAASYKLLKEQFAELQLTAHCDVADDDVITSPASESSFQQVKKHLEDKLISLEFEIESLKNENSKLNEQSNTLKNKVQFYENQSNLIGSLTSEIENLKIENNRLLDSCNSLKTRSNFYDDQSKLISSLTSELESIKLENFKLTENFATLQSQLKFHEDQSNLINNLYSEIDTLKLENSRLSDNSQLSKLEISKLKSENEQLINQINELSTRNQHVEALRDEAMTFVGYQSSLSKSLLEKTIPSHNSTVSAVKVLLAASSPELVSSAKVLLARCNYLSNTNSQLKNGLLKLNSEIANVKRCQRFIKELTKTSFNQMIMTLTNLTLELAGCWSKMRSLLREERERDTVINTRVISNQKVEESTALSPEPIASTKNSAENFTFTPKKILTQRALTVEDLQSTTTLSQSESSEIFDDSPPLSVLVDSFPSRVVTFLRFRSLFSKHPSVSLNLSSPGVVNLVVNSEHRSFKTDGVFGPGVENSVVFESIKSLSTLPLDSKSLLIVSYGPRSSGRSYSLFGTSSDSGLISLIISHLFSILPEYQETRSISASFCAVDVTSNDVLDLLTEEEELVKAEKSTTLSCFLHVPLPSAEEFQAFSDLIVTSDTSSSRTHRLVSVTFDILDLVTNQRSQSRLSFLDCAQSDSSRGMSGSTSRMSRSLAALGDVLTAVQVSSSHVPFRNSKLTHLLQDCLLPVSDSRVVLISHCNDDVASLFGPISFASSINQASV